MHCTGLLDKQSYYGRSCIADILTPITYCSILAIHVHDYTI